MSQTGSFMNGKYIFMMRSSVFTLLSHQICIFHICVVEIEVLARLCLPEFIKLFMKYVPEVSRVVCCRVAILIGVS